MIHQVVYNLVENAVKFVNPQGYIDVRVLNKGTKAVVKIRNSGQGISATRFLLFLINSIRPINPEAWIKTVWAWDFIL